MNGWSHKKIIFYFFCKFDLLRKKLENNFFMRAAVLCANIFQIFVLNWIIKNICCCLFKSLFNWSPHFFTSFSKPAGIPTDSSENSTASVMGFNWYPNINQKWNWFQIFLSEIHESPKNGSRGVFFLISGFLKGLRHSAMVNKMLLTSQSPVNSANIWSSFCYTLHMWQARISRLTYRYVSS